MLRGLHKLCDKGNWEDALDSLGTLSGRSNAQEKGGWGDWSPLHIACKRNPTKEIIESLIEAAPQMTACSDMYQRYPIHYAAEWGANLDVLEVLSHANPLSVTATDVDGRTPLHLSILGSKSDSQQQRTSPDVLEVNVLTSGGAVSGIADKEGNLPLHCACEIINLMHEDSLLVLVESCKKALTVRNLLGETPIHIALVRNTQQTLSLNSTKALLGNGKVARMKNCDGKLPIHVACEVQPTIDVLDEILLQNKEGTSVRDSRGMYPLELLEKIRPMILSSEDLDDFNCKSDLVFAHFPDILPFRKEYSRLQRIEALICYEAKNGETLSDIGSMLWIWLCTSSNKDCDQIHSASIENIVRECEEDEKAIKILLNTETDQGDLIRDCIDPNRDAAVQPFLRFLDHFKIEGITSLFHVGKSSTFIRAKDLSVPRNKRDVLICFETRRDMYLRKKFIHDLILKEKNKDTPIAPILQTFDADRVGTVEEEPLDKYFCERLKSQENIPTYVKTSRQATVMLKVGKCLDEVLRHKHITTMEKRALVKSIGSTLKKIHEKNVVHSNVNLKNIVHKGPQQVSFIDLGYATIISSEFMLGTQCSLSRRALTPELVAKLNTSEHDRYLRYWRSVKENATISNLFCGEEITTITNVVDSYLHVNSESTFKVFWDQIQNQSNLWTEIRPQKFVSEENYETWYYVPKCYILENETRAPYKYKCLPYDLVPTASAHDVFGYGMLLLQLYSDEEPSISNVLDLRALHHWNFEPPLDHVRDPLVRELILSLTSKVKSRPASMVKVLLHPFFTFPTTEGSKLLRSRQIARQAEYRKAQQIIVLQNFRRQFRARSISLPNLISASTQIKVFHSTCKQWMKHLPSNYKGKIVFPTSFIILPYRLPASDVELAHSYTLYLLQVFSLTQITDKIGKKYCNLPVNNSLRKVVEYTNLIEQQRTTTSNAIALCENIIQLAHHATKIIASILNGLQDETDEIASMIVTGKLSEYLDIKQCSDVLNKVQGAETAMSQLLDGMVTESKLKAKTIIHEQFDSIVENTFKETISKNRLIIENELKSLIRSFVDNPFLACKVLLREKVDKFLQLFSDKGHFYFVDEFDAKPVTANHSSYPFEVDRSMIRDLLPSMNLSVKAICSIHTSERLAKQLGLENFKTNVRENLDMFSLGKAWEQTSCLMEMATLHSVLNNEVILSDVLKVSELEGSINFDMLDSFIREKDPNHIYANMVRIEAAGESILWTTKINVEKIAEEGYAELQNYVKELGKGKNFETSDPDTQKETTFTPTSFVTTENLKLSGDKHDKIDSSFIMSSMYRTWAQKLRSNDTSFEVLFPGECKAANEEKISEEQEEKNVQPANEENNVLEKVCLTPDDKQNVFCPLHLELCKSGSNLESREQGSIFRELQPTTPEDTYQRTSPESMYSEFSPDEKPANLNVSQNKQNNSKDYKDPTRQRWTNAFTKLASRTERRIEHSIRDDSSYSPFSPRNLQAEPLSRKEIERLNAEKRIERDRMHNNSSNLFRKRNVAVPRSTFEFKERSGFDTREDELQSILERYTSS